MKALYCDICKKELHNPVVERSYYHIREFEICETCKDALDMRLRPVVREHFPYSVEWYEQQVVGLIERGVSTSRA